MTISTLQMETLRRREVKWLLQGHLVWKRRVRFELRISWLQSHSPLTALPILCLQNTFSYLIRFSELNREATGWHDWKTASGCRWRTEDRRDWPPGRRQHKWGLHRSEGLHLERESGSTFPRLPRAPSILGMLPARVREASPRQGHHCLLVEGHRRASVVATGALQW